MGKVQVNKEVAEILKDIGKTYKDSSSLDKFRVLLNRSQTYRERTIEEWFEKQNISPFLIYEAFQDGWEVECEFNLGDIVSYTDEVTEFDVFDRIVYITADKSVATLANGKEDKNYYLLTSKLKLVCKSDNREDLK
jgi:hypothetical protein